MKHHATDRRCPFCDRPLTLTTEWGWIDDETCTAVLCCPSCRTLTDHAEDAVAIAHVARDGRESEEAETDAMTQALDIGLPAPRG